MGFSTSILTLIWVFFKTFLNILVADIAFELSFIGQQFAYLFYSWGYSISQYGLFIPIILTGIVGVTIMGLFLVFALVDGGKALVGGGE